MSQPNILDVMRMYQKERGWSYQQARDIAIEEYKKRGWWIPPSVESLYARKK